ncbi:ATP-binding cassette domain-containing protein [Streptomyces sp. NPDC006314]|uniref:ATP-binding cassette domain-containing protein n=1 Tax=Streptomyces sp. NPDC006314 TaxID=3154475 RepID=UPI0033BBC9BA
MLQVIQAFGLTSDPRKAHPPAVDDVSFEARPGHVTALLGGAGAGKTTALRLMLELQPGRGITYFRGRPLHRIAHPAREVGVLLGDVPGHPARSVRGHLRMLCASSGVPARRADEVLEVVGLVSLREERLGTLSRGMDRRLGLACALLPDPHTLVLDEPTDGLSAREAQWLHSMLRTHAHHGGTVLFTTADPKEAARTTDRVITLDGGRLVADQEAKEFARTRLRPRVAVRSPHAARLAALLTKEARTARRSVEVVREDGNRLSVYGSTTADVGETAFRHGILIHQLADEVGDMGPGAGTGTGGEKEAAGTRPAQRETVVPDSSTAAQERTASDACPEKRDTAGPAFPSGEWEPPAADGPAADHGRAASRSSAPQPARAVLGFPSVEQSGAAGDVPPVDRESMEPASPTADRRSAGPALPATAPGGAECGSLAAEPGNAECGSVTESGTSAPDVSRPERETPALGGTSEKQGIARSGVPSKEREHTAGGLSAPECGGSGLFAGHEPLGASADDGRTVSDPSAWERTQTGPGERSSLGKDPRRASAPERSQSIRAAPAQGASSAAAVCGTGGKKDHDAAGAGGGAAPAKVAAGAEGNRSAKATAAPHAGQAGVSASSESQAGSTSSAAGIPATRTRLPGARNPGTSKPQPGRAVRPDGVRPVDALSPLPPPILVRPAPTPLRPLRYEIRRATGVGTGFLTCGAALVLSALTAVVLARIGHTPQARLFAAWPRELPLPPAALAAGLLGALAFGDEFRHPALAADRGTVPRRLGLLTAKLLVSGATALLLAFLTVGCDAEVLYIVYGPELTRVPPDWLSLSASWFGLVSGCAWAGVLAAGVFRSTTAGLAAVLGVPVVVVPLVHKALQGSGTRMAAGFPMRMREVLLLQWPFGGERYLLAVVRVLAQPVGGALVLSLTGLLCAYLLTTLRARVR